MGTSLSLLIAAGCLVLFSLKRIPDGQAYTVHRFGRYCRTLPSGVHWILPLVERIAHRVSLTGRALRIEPRALSGIGVHAGVRGTVWYQVLDPERVDREFEHLDDVVLGEVCSALRRLGDSETPMGSSLNDALKHEANGELREHGVVITRFKLQTDATRTGH
ncbi:MAG TPA: SPFH domain-containing protein [Candidatus Saccharimonadia bacterium]|nr:SPFH domain-containing protein [Candidatus Saccharimonadia bacterium]